MMTQFLPSLTRSAQLPAPEAKIAVPADVEFLGATYEDADTTV